MQRAMVMRGGLPAPAEDDSERLDPKDLSRKGNGHSGLEIAHERSRRFGLASRNA